MIEHKEFFDKGKRGFVYTAEYNGKKVLIKEHNPNANINTIQHEAEMTKKLNTIGVGPKFIAYKNNQLIREFIAGERIEDYLEQATIDEAKSIIKQVLEQCVKMDEKNINKFEMTHPYKHILITPKNKVVMIDFERCKHTEKPKNVTQFCQYIARITPLLSKIGLDIDADEIRELGMKYKQQEYDKKVFAQLVEVFS